jgi:hypothetical protein
MITLRWNPHVELWIMCNGTGREMYRFFDCVNLNILYKNLDKTMVNFYQQEPLEPVKKEALNAK